MVSKLYFRNLHTALLLIGSSLYASRYLVDDDVRLLCVGLNFFTCSPSWGHYDQVCMSMGIIILCKLNSTLMKQVDGEVVIRFFLSVSSGNELQNIYPTRTILAAILRIEG
jgi:hypothetical protein